MEASAYLDIDGQRLYYEIAGTGDPLVLCHAGFVDSRMWDAQWTAFAEHYRVIRYDMRGYGQSDPAHGPISRRAELRHLLDALKIERAVLAGCSMGGEAVLDLTLEQPERVRALVLVSAAPTGFEMQGEPQVQLMAMIAAVQQGDLERASELQIQLWFDGGFRRPDAVDPQLRQRAAEMNMIAVRNNTWAIADTHAVDPLDPPAIERLDELSPPVLILAGALDHPEILRAADVMQAAIPGAEKRILPDSAHVPNMEQPDLFNQLVLDFLQML